MASEFIVKNFKAIKEAKIQVSGLTMIQGASSAGKSSLFQAIQAAMTNRFKARQVRHGESSATVLMRFTDRKDKDGKMIPLKVQRSYTGGSPVYILGDKKWSKLNRDLPLEVREYLNLGVVNVSSSETYNLNFFQQFQPPLLKEFSQKKIMDVLSVSKSLTDLTEVKKEVELNRVRNEGEFKALDSILSESKGRLAVVEMSLDSMVGLDLAKEKVLSIQSIDSSISQLDNLLLLCNELSSLKDKLSYLNRLESLQNRYGEVINVLNSTETIIKSKDNSKLISLFQKFYTVRTKHCKVSELTSLIKSIDFRDIDLESYQKILNLKSRISEVSDLIKLLEMLRTSVYDCRTLSMLKGSISQQIDYVTRLKDKEKQIEVNESMIDKLVLLRQLKETQDLEEKRLSEIMYIVDYDLCPICKRPLSECADN